MSTSTNIRHRLNDPSSDWKPTALLIRSDYIGWTGLRTALQESRIAQVSEEVADADEAVVAASDLHPDVIFVASSLQGVSAAPLVVRLHSRSPLAKVVMLGEESSHRDFTLLLGKVGLDGYLYWPDITSKVVQHCVETILVAGLNVFSPSVMQAFANVTERPNFVGRKAVAVNEREQAVLLKMAKGIPRADIARMEHLSERTVKRIIAGLEAKFEAETAFVLGMKVALAGYVA